MDAFEAIERRHSYRGEFKGESIPREDLERIVDAGIRAPSGCNAQTTSFVIVDSSETLSKIADLVERPFTRTASAMIVCVAEHRAVYEDMAFGVEDCAASVENILLAITAMGYASVWIDGMLRKDGISGKIASILDIPDDLDVRVLLPVGVPVEEKPQRDRKSFGERAWFNQWKG